MAPVVVPGGSQVLFGANAADAGSAVGVPPAWGARLEPGGWVDRQVAGPGRTADGTQDLAKLLGQFPDGDALLKSDRDLDQRHPGATGVFRVQPMTLDARLLAPAAALLTPISTVPAVGPIPVASFETLTEDAQQTDPYAEKAYRLNADGYALASVLPDGRPAPESVSVPADKAFFAGPLDQDAYGERSIAGGRRHGASADGSRLFFTAGPYSYSASHGTAGPLYRNDVIGGSIPISVSQRTGDRGALSVAIFNGASPDGDVVFFSAALPLTDGAEGPGVYRLVVSTGTLTRLTPSLPAASSAPPESNPEPTLPLDIRSGWASGDGSTFVFVATNTFAEGANDGGRNAYAWRNGQLRFLGDLGPDGRVKRISRDGDFAVLAGAADIAGASTGGFTQVFRYDWPRDRLQCASCRPDGSTSQGKADVDSDQAPGVNAPLRTAPRGIDDAGHVYFTSRDRLVAQDRSDGEDAYEFTGDGVRLLSAGEGRTYVTDNTDDGASVFLSSSAALTADDQDGGDFDLYVRRSGATPPVPPVVAAPCSGDSCQRPAAAAPSGPPFPGSARAGAGNVARRSTAALLGAPRLTRTARLALRRGRAGRLTLRLRGPGRLRLRAVAVDRVVARRTLRITRSGAHTVRTSLRLSHAARRILRRGGRLRIRLTATLGPSRRTTVLTLRGGSR